MSFIIDSYTAPEVVKTFALDVLLVNYNRETQQFAIHLLYGTYNSLKRKDGWVPISSELIRKHWGKNKVHWDTLVRDGLIEVKSLGKFVKPDGSTSDKTYSKILKLSREFRITAGLLDVISSKFPKNLEESLNCQYFNLMTGFKVKKYKKHRLTDETGHSIPKLVKESILCIERTILNEDGLTPYLDEFEMSIEQKDYENPTWLKFKNDEQCFKGVLRKNAIPLKDGLIQYEPSYEMQISGRISEQGGGMQSCSRKMKSVAFQGIPNLKNYDLVSSQVWGLIQFFEAANLNTAWLVTYLSANKQIFADQVGINKDCWKACFLSLIMGALMLTPKAVEKLGNIEEADLAILNYITKELKNDKALVLQAYLKFYEVIAPLKKEIDKWHTWLIEEHVPLVSSWPGGVEYVYNKTGARFPLWQYRNPDCSWKHLNELKRKLAAFFLQGNEAAFIHHLTCLSKSYDFEVISNQADGLITLGEIPQVAIEIAKKASGLRYAKLEEKAFL